MNARDDQNEKRMLFTQQQSNVMCACRLCTEKFNDQKGKVYRLVIVFQCIFSINFLLISGNDLW